MDSELSQTTKGENMMPPDKTGSQAISHRISEKLLTDLEYVCVLCCTFARVASISISSTSMLINLQSDNTGECYPLSPSSRLPLVFLGCCISARKLYTVQLQINMHKNKHLITTPYWSRYSRYLLVIAYLTNKIQRGNQRH